MLSSISEVSTASASTNLKKLCRHLSHKVKVTFDETHGEVIFPFGSKGSLDATDGLLRMTIEANDQEALDRTEQVMADHLVRFASRETLVVQWQHQD